MGIVAIEVAIHTFFQPFLVMVGEIYLLNTNYHSSNHLDLVLLSCSLQDISRDMGRFSCNLEVNHQPRAEQTLSTSMHFSECNASFSCFSSY